MFKYWKITGGNFEKNLEILGRNFEKILEKLQGSFMEVHYENDLSEKDLKKFDKSVFNGSFYRIFEKFCAGNFNKFC